MNPSLNTKLKIFQKSVNRVRALISFKKIQTFEECFRELAIPRECWCDGSGGITITQFNTLIPIVEEKLRAWWISEPKEKVKENTNEPTWNVSDALIESTEYTGHSAKGKHQERLDYLRSLCPPKNEAQQGKALYFQEEAALELFKHFKIDEQNAALLRANTGDGKTFCAGQLIRWILDSKYLDTLAITPWKILYVTGASIVSQSAEDLSEHFGIDIVTEVQVTNYESLRSSFGIERFLDKKLIVEQGEEHEVWEWKKFIHPALIIWDECHKLKNEDSIQSKIAQACNNLNYIFPLTNKPAKVLQLFMSASPFSRVVHAKTFAVATKHSIEWGTGRKIITNANWMDVARKVCNPADPREYSKQAIKKFLKEFKPYIFTFKNVRRKHKGILETTILDFLSDVDAAKYKKAWDEFVERKQQLEGMEYGNSKFLLLVQLLVFRQAAELIKAFQLARIAYEDYQQGFAPVLALGFKPTIAKIVLHMVNDFNIPRDKISIIWGGVASMAGSDKKFTREVIHETLARAFKDPESVSLRTIKQIHQQLQYEAEGLGDIPADLRLGTQSKEMRNSERKRFQTGKTQFCFITFGAGKEGLSLHQNEDYLRPRRQTNSTTYNEMEMLQVEGRTARITSKSDTLIRTTAYRDTIEVPVLKRVMAKRQCLNVVMNHGVGKEIIVDNAFDRELAKVMELLGGSDEDNEIEESVYEEAEQEIAEEDDTNEG